MIYLIKQDWVYVRTRSTLDSFTPVTVKRTISDYRKIQEISPGAYIFQRPFLRGLVLEGLIFGGKFAFQNRLRLPSSWRKFTVFALFYFVFEGNFQVQAPGGLIFGGAYTWRGLFSEFYGISHSLIISKESKHMLINDKSLGLYGDFYRWLYWFLKYN